LANWIHQDLLILGEELRLIWQPGLDWAAELERVQASPRPWPGPRPPDAGEQVEALIKQMTEEEWRAKLGQALSKLEEQ
jgi:hypothetical protein